MAMSASSMESKIEAALTALGIPAARFTVAMGTDGLTPRQILTAFCTGIIAEITTNQVVADTPNDGPGHTHLPHVIS